MEIGNVAAFLFIAGILGFAIRRTYIKFVRMQSEGGAACGCSGCDSCSSSVKE